MATRSSTLAWRIPMDRGAWQGIFLFEIPWAEKPGGLQSKGLQRVRHSWSNLHARMLISIIYIEREIKKCLELALVKTTVCGSYGEKACTSSQSCCQPTTAIIFQIVLGNLIPDAGLQGPWVPQASTSQGQGAFRKCSASVFQKRKLRLREQRKPHIWLPSGCFSPQTIGKSRGNLCFLKEKV